jgi:hypothetical protein
MITDAPTRYAHAYATSAYAYNAGDPACVRAAAALADAYAVVATARAEQTAAWLALETPDLAGACLARFRAACTASNAAHDALDAARLDYGAARDAAGI